MITNNKNPELWVISDTHLIADKIHDRGPAFDQMQKTSQGKDLFYQEIALSAFVKMAQEKKPDAIVVTGDVTFNGEKISAERFQKIFSSLTKTKLLVVPGNHDIYDGWARSFTGKQQIPTEQLSPNDWQQIFNVSYQQAISKDPNSLAYAVQLNSDYLLLLLDSNYYGANPSTKAPFTRGNISAEELEWLKQVLIEAKHNKLHSIAFMHHNLFVHNSVVNRGFVLDNADKVRELFSTFDVKLNFSGHIHAQNIKQLANTTDIATSSFCSYDQGYGVVKFTPQSISYQRKTFDMAPYLTTEQKNHEVLTNFHDYLKNLQIANMAADLVQQDLQNFPNELPLVMAMGNLMANISFNFFTGHNHLSQAELAKIKDSDAYRGLKKYHPAQLHFIETLYDTSDHSNLEAIIHY